MSESQKPPNTNTSQPLIGWRVIIGLFTQDFQGAAPLTLAQQRYPTTEGPDVGPHDVCDHGITDRIVALEAVITHKISRKWPLVGWCSLFRRKTDVYLEWTSPGESNFSWTIQVCRSDRSRRRHSRKKKTLRSMSCSVFLRSDSNVNAANHMNQRLLSCQLQLVTTGRVENNGKDPAAHNSNSLN